MNSLAARISKSWLKRATLTGSDIWLTIKATGKQTEQRLLRQIVNVQLDFTYIQPCQELWSESSNHCSDQLLVSESMIPVSRSSWMLHQTFVFEASFQWQATVDSYIAALPLARVVVVENGRHKKSWHMSISLVPMLASHWGLPDWIASQVS